MAVAVGREEILDPRFHASLEIYQVCSILKNSKLNRFPNIISSSLALELSFSCANQSTDKTISLGYTQFRKQTISGPQSDIWKKGSELKHGQIGRAHV